MIIDFNAVKQQKAKEEKDTHNESLERGAWKNVIEGGVSNVEWEFLKSRGYTTPASFYQHQPASIGMFYVLDPREGLTLSMSRFLDGWLNYATVIENREDGHRNVIVKIGEAVMIIHHGEDASRVLWCDALYARAVLDFHYADGYLRALDRTSLNTITPTGVVSKDTMDVATHCALSDPTGELGHDDIIYCGIRDIVVSVNDSTMGTTEYFLKDILTAISWRKVVCDLDELKGLAARYRCNRYSLGGYSLLDTVVNDETSFTRALLTAIMANLYVSGNGEILTDHPVEMYQGVVSTIVGHIGVGGTTSGLTGTARTIGLDVSTSKAKGKFVSKSPKDIEEDIKLLGEMVKITAPYFNDVFDLILG